MIRFTCPKCNKRLKGPIDKIGHKVKCSRCSEELAIPDIRDESLSAGIIAESECIKESVKSTPASEEQVESTPNISQKHSQLIGSFAYLLAVVVIVYFLFFRQSTSSSLPTINVSDEIKQSFVFSDWRLEGVGKITACITAKFPISPRFEASFYDANSTKIGEEPVVINSSSIKVGERVEIHFWVTGKLDRIKVIKIN